MFQLNLSSGIPVMKFSNELIYRGLPDDYPYNYFIPEADIKKRIMARDLTKYKEPTTLLHYLYRLEFWEKIKPYMFYPYTHECGILFSVIKHNMLSILNQHGNPRTKLECLIRDIHPLALMYVFRNHDVMDIPGIAENIDIFIRDIDDIKSKCPNNSDISLMVNELADTGIIKNINQFDHQIDNIKKITGYGSGKPFKRDKGGHIVKTNKEYIQSIISRYGIYQDPTELILIFKTSKSMKDLRERIEPFLNYISKVYTTNGQDIRNSYNILYDIYIATGEKI